MVYETDLLNPMWWITSLVGNIYLFLGLIQLFLMSKIRKIPNVKFLALVMLGINGIIMFYGILQNEGNIIDKGLFVLVMIIYAFIVWGGENS